MCGRYAFATYTEAVREHYGILGAVPRLAPRPEVFPTEPVPVVAAKPDGSRAVALVRWGITPAWADRPLVNARSEGAAFKPTFRELFRAKRCLIPATGFYEWAAVGRKKVRHRVTFPGRGLVSFAGLWDAPAGSPGVVILTTAANPVVAAVHDRMPVVIPPAAYARWLDWGTPVPELLGMTAAVPAEATEVADASDVDRKATPSLF
jgi:putative SOS response-associated peptidase YedK